MNRLISWLSIPWLDYGIRARGWQWFIENHIAREVRWFEEGEVTPRFCLHNPGFTPLGQVMFEFDQFLQADRRLRVLRAQFAEAWKPVTEVREVICYLGGLRWKDDPERESYNPGNYEDPNFARLVRLGRWDAWL